MLNIETESSGAQSRLTPALALMFFTDAQGRAHTYKVPLHQVAEDEYELGAPVQGTAADLQALRSCLDGGVYLHHEHVLSSGNGTLLWWVPAGRRALFFDVRVEAAKGIEALNGRPVPHPPLLFRTQGGLLSVFALRENARPTLETALYRAPYWNMFDHGRMCMGTVKLPPTIDPQRPEEVTQRFFESNFSGASRLDLSAYPASHQQMWEEADRLGRFDPQWLLPEQGVKTLKEALTCTGTR